VNWAHAHVDLTVMSLLTLAIPVVAVITAAIFLQESIEWIQVLGIAVVLTAVGVVAVGTTRPSVGEQGHGEALVAAD
jgi:drug/metabolite transporter (DMT)-like permease